MTNFQDIATMTKRSFYLSLKIVDGWLTAFILPITILLAFVYIFGGAFEDALNKSKDYLQYLLPGIFTMAIGQVATSTAVKISSDKENGILKRFQTMPILQSSPLFGDTNITILKSILSLAFVFIVASLLSFKWHGTVISFIILGLVVILIVTLISWIGFLWGLFTGVETAGILSFAFIFLPYISSAVVPLNTMPQFLQTVGKYSPFTSVTEIFRGCLENTLTNSQLLHFALWYMPAMIIVVIFTLNKYKKI